MDVDAQPVSPRVTGADDVVNTAKEAARKLKKRELDRKAQRVARERTKNRIQELESLVEQLKADNASSGLLNLTRKLDQITQQRDELKSVIQSLDYTFQRHVRGRELSQVLSPPGEAPQQPPFPTQASCVHSPNWEGFPSSWSSLPTVKDTDTFHGNDTQLLVEAATTQPQTRLQLAETAEPWTSRQPLEADHCQDIIVPSPDWPCDCAPQQPPPTAQGGRRGGRNTWRTANAALGKPTPLSTEQLTIEDFTSHDTPIRVVLQGWDSVERDGKMSVSWRKLRAVDEACFSRCGPVERLGVLRTMHLLLAYHGDGSHARRDKMARWMWTRPSQALPHSYAIDFFVWPGLRERFVFWQHRYCTNLFWQHFHSCLQIQWPLDLGDCYTTDPVTGRYQLSSVFDQNLRNINCWTMRPDFFAQFPELGEDIPVSGSIPRTLVLWTAEEELKHQRVAQQGDSKANSTSTSTNDVGDPMLSVYACSSVGEGLEAFPMVVHEHHGYDSLREPGTYPAPVDALLPESPWPAL